MKKVIIIFIVNLFTVGAFAQDYHLSQFDVIPMAVNPAHTGMKSDVIYRAATVYRSQWRTLSSKPFTTFGLAYDMEVKDRWGAGIFIIDNNQARTYNSLTFLASGAYEITDPTQNKHKITTGLQAGIIYNTINESDFTFDNQYENGDFNSNLLSKEVFTKMSKVMPEINFGIAYKWTDRNRDYHPYVNIAVAHVLSPKNSFVTTSEEASRLPRKFTFNGGSEYIVNKQLRFDGQILTMFQAQSSEILFGLNSFYKIQENADTEIKLGLFYRNQDAFILTLGVEYLGLTYAMSFDFTTSNLNQADRGTGALEFSLTFSPFKNASAPRH